MQTPAMTPGTEKWFYETFGADDSNHKFPFTPIILNTPTTRKWLMTTPLDNVKTEWTPINLEADDIAVKDEDASECESTAATDKSSSSGAETATGAATGVRTAKKRQRPKLDPETGKRPYDREAYKRTRQKRDELRRKGLPIPCDANGGKYYKPRGAVKRKYVRSGKYVGQNGATPRKFKTMPPSFHEPSRVVEA